MKLVVLVVVVVKQLMHVLYLYITCRKGVTVPHMYISVQYVRRCNCTSTLKLRCSLLCSLADNLTAYLVQVGHHLHFRE